MAKSIVGTLHLEHSVDPNGSLCLDVAIAVPPGKLSPEISVSYHSAVAETSVLGVGWELHAFGFLERVGATVAQDGFAGSVHYDSKDQYLLNGQRLVPISDSRSEYRFEIEQWSKIVPVGGDPANPEYWVEYRPDGTVRKYGSTADSNLKAVNHTATRVWALAEAYDPFSNYASYFYTPADGSGSLTIDSIAYGGNQTLRMQHQRKVVFAYQNRDDVRTEFVGGSPVTLAKRLASITSYFDGALVHTHTFDYGGYAPVTGVSRLQNITISDPSGSSVLPLRFDWSQSPTTVFDTIAPIEPLKVGSKEFTMLPMSVAGSGRTDLVLASKQWDSHTSKYFLNLDSYVTREDGEIPDKPQTSQLKDLRYPDQLLALDVNGDGKTDLLHISKDAIRREHKLTILLSSSDGYVPQEPFTFKPPALDGKYYTGDFEGNGYVGLAYIYKDGSGGSTSVGVQQLTSNGRCFTACDPVQSPGGVKFDELQVVIADPDGKGTDGIFVLSPTFIDPSYVWRMDFFEPHQKPNEKGLLGYTDRFRKVGETIHRSKNSAFLALPERDGKTGLLLVSQDASGRLQYQTLRSTGKSLADSGLKKTQYRYQGNINVGHTTSLTSLNLINIVQNPLDRTTELFVLRLANDEFVDIGKVTQPEFVHNYDASFVDLRGVGRTDCLFSFYDKLSNKLLLSKLSSANSVTRLDPLVSANPAAPPDYIVGYTNGLGATLSAAYASLTDSTVYKKVDEVSGPANPYVNALARVASSRVVMDLSKGEVQSNVMGSSRTQLIRFPKYVVKQLTTCALPATQPTVISTDTYSYENARISFDGRGWLGFETVVVKSEVLRTKQVSTYKQEFPFVGTAYATNVFDISGTGEPVKLKSTISEWESHQTGHRTQCYSTIRAINQTTYEKGNPAYAVDLTYEYDPFANLIQAKISVSGKPDLVIDRTYENHTISDRWIIGNQLSEAITSGEKLLMSQTHFEYLEGTQSIKKTTKWVGPNSPPAVEDLSYDAAGNVEKSVGPWKARQTFVYDRTLSFPVSFTSAVDDTSSLTAVASYNYGLGEIDSMTEYNGHITKRQYDVLGREVQISEGESLDNMTIIGKREYKRLNNDFVCMWSTLCDIVSDSWRTETEYLDGMERKWKTAVPNASDPSETVYNQILLDGAGRIIRKYRSYTSKTSNSLYASFSYDGLSRPTTAIYPPVTSELDPVTINYDYSSNDGKTTVTRTSSCDSQKGGTRATTVLEYFPNNETGSDEFVVPLTVASIDELGQEITTEFDALRRVLQVVDPSGVCLSHRWDGISRMIHRSISNAKGPNVSDFSISYDDTGTKTITNNCAQPKIEIVYAQDLLGRLTKMDGGGVTTTYTYDDPKVGAQGRLSSITSSTGVSEAFTYNPQGCKKTSSMTIDDRTFPTSFEYTTSRALSKVTNPDNSVLTNTYFSNTNVLKQAQLDDGHSDKSVSTRFSHFDNGFFLPQVCDMGNGLTSTVDLALNGVPLKAVLSHDSTTLLQQTWTLSSSSRLKSYNPSSSEDTKRFFEYNNGGQLFRSSPSSHSLGLEYEYDASGNISSKDGHTFVNDGWQLSLIKDSSENVISSFQYTPDGHLDKQRDGSDKVIRAMTYDALGRTTAVNSTKFVYDSAGRMVKADRGDSVTYYPSTMYEVTVQGDTETRTAYLVRQNRCASISTDVSSGVLGDPTILYYHADHLGSVVAVSDESGKLVTTYSYDDYGVATVTPESNIKSRYKYSGKEDFEGLYYFGARFYDPAIGRFFTLDDIDLSLESITASSLNQYSFSNNDPVNFIDANGNSAWWHWAWHLLADTALIVTGIALFFVPGYQVAAETLLGAGIGGLQYDIEAAINHKDLNDWEWGKSVLIGGVLSFAMAGLGGAMAGGSGRVANYLKSVKFLKAVGKQGKGIGKSVGRLIGKTGYGKYGSSESLVSSAFTKGLKNIGSKAWAYGGKQMAKGVTFSSLFSVGLQMTENLATGKGALEGWDTALERGVINGVTGGLVKGGSKYAKSFRTLKHTGYIGPAKFYNHPDLPEGPEIMMSGSTPARALVEAPSGFFT